MSSFRYGPLYTPGPGRSGIANPIVGGTTSQSNLYAWAQPYPSTQQPQSTPTQRGSISFAPSQYQPTSTTTTSTMTPTAPGIAMPTFALPPRNEERVRELRRSYMAPVRQVRQGLRRTLAALPSTSNIAVARELGRGAVEGLGTSISQISESAGRQARAEYSAERAEEITALQTNFNAAMADYLARWGQTTTSQQTSGFGTGSTGAGSTGTQLRPRMTPWGMSYSYS